ncbi:hypothetical protein DPEC_G00154240 [Dallia pectoralis]|uniref:Uncharacterized protein n=1 Tax=Dallia pectoralis TaxID=75939 RepID=A0ACC2GK20_DALPE|nr:hypothetical protein DPEC_G00154240 [Dallia pectoralis]
MTVPTHKGLAPRRAHEQWKKRGFAGQHFTPATMDQPWDGGGARARGGSGQWWSLASCSGRCTLRKRLKAGPARQEPTLESSAALLCNIFSPPPIKLVWGSLRGARGHVPLKDRRPGRLPDCSASPSSCLKRNVSTRHMRM